MQHLKKFWVFVIIHFPTRALDKWFARDNCSLRSHWPATGNQLDDWAQTLWGIFHKILKWKRGWRLHIDLHFFTKPTFVDNMFILINSSDQYAVMEFNKTCEWCLLFPKNCEWCLCFLKAVNGTCYLKETFKDTLKAYIC